jgi:hypothetical protein
MVVPPPDNGLVHVSVVYLLLRAVPIQGSVQLQYHVFAQPPNTYFSVKNVMVFIWGESPDNLKNKQFSVSYFPVSSEKDVVKILSFHDDRVWADDQPMPKYNQPDPDFKGNRWLAADGKPLKP